MYPFNGEWVGWQQSCYATAAGADYTEIALYILYTGNCNKAKFTNIFLHREAYGTTFGYDDKGNVLSISNLAGQHSKSTYDSEDNEQTYIQPGREDKAENQYWAYYGDSDADRKKHLPWRTPHADERDAVLLLRQLRQPDRQSSGGLPRIHRRRRGERVSVHAHGDGLRRKRKLHRHDEGCARQCGDAECERQRWHADQRDRPDPARR